MYGSHNITRIYVSQKYGDDRFAGFYKDNNTHINKGPVKTIERALGIVKELRRFGAEQPITIKLIDDEYIVDKPVLIDSDISSVIIEGENETTISGGIKLTGFRKDTFNSQACVSADVEELLNKGIWFTDFYVNKKRASMTRYPEKGYLLPKEVEDDGYTMRSSSKWFVPQKADFDIFFESANLEDAVISYNHWWIDEHSPIESVLYDEEKIVMKYPSLFSVCVGVEKTEMKYIVENLPECFKNCGEWYLDRKTKKVYYIPYDGENVEGITAYAPVTEKLFVISGKNGKKVNNVTFRNLSFAYTKGELCNEIAAENGEVTKYGAYHQSVFGGCGTIELEHAHSCRIENCEVNCIGVHAIVIKNGCNNIDISNNEISICGGGGITVCGGKIEAEKDNHTYAIRITDNKITEGGRKYQAACGVLIRHAYECIVSHNEIANFYYSGISLGWTWGYEDSICRDNLIEHNHVYNIGYGLLSDMGAIYVLGKNKGTIIRNNLLHNVSCCVYGGWGIYTDEGSSYMRIENNIVYDCSSGAYNQNYGAMNTVTNNIFMYGSTAVIRYLRMEMHPGIIFDTNIFITEGGAIFETGISKMFQAPHSVSSCNNIIWDTACDSPVIFETEGKKYTLKETQEQFGFEFDSIVADPLVENIKERNFVLKSDSPAFDKGFKQIDISKVGVRR
ncbi:MAG: right-handed parallel beta-helix repeat-containing protein [Clostridia bacterium]|nr:right-handed parallel beta-helix repeat-containing protein [Clostridia bacterium]